MIQLFIHFPEFSFIFVCKASSAKKKKNIDETPMAALTGRKSAQIEKVHLLKKRHHCQQHKKLCLVQNDSSHYHLTTNDLAKWALLMVCRLDFYIFLS
jgi:hypothetical protein